MGEQILDVTVLGPAEALLLCASQPFTDAGAVDRTPGFPPPPRTHATRARTRARLLRPEFGAGLGMRVGLGGREKALEHAPLGADMAPWVNPAGPRRARRARGASILPVGPLEGRLGRPSVLRPLLGGSAAATPPPDLH